METGELSCYKCRRRLTAADFQAGAALRVGTLATCEACAGALLNRLTPEQRRSVLKQHEETLRAADAAGGAPGAAVRAAFPRPPAPRPAAAPGPGPVRLRVAAVAAAAVLLLALGLLLRGGRTPEPAPRSEIPPRTAAPAGRKAPAPKGEEPEGAPTAVWRQELSELEQEVQTASQQQEYRKALDLLEQARARRMDPAWTAAVDAQRKALEESLRRFFDWVKAQALEAQQGGIASGVVRWRETVASWGLPAYAAELDQALSAAGQPLPLAEPDRAALRRQLDRISLRVLPDANSRAMARLKALGIQPAPMTWEEVVDAGGLTPATCPVLLYAGVESYRLTVKAPRDVPQALIRYVRAGGTLAVFPSGPWPFFSDENKVPNAHPMSPLLPISGSWESPPAGTRMTFTVLDRRALPHVPARFRFPADGDMRWRPIRPAQAKAGTRVVPLVELLDEAGQSQGVGSAWMHAGEGRVLYAWFRLLDLPEGDALFHDLWQTILARPDAPR